MRGRNVVSTKATAGTVTSPGEADWAVGAKGVSTKLDGEGTSTSGATTEGANDDRANAAVSGVMSWLSVNATVGAKDVSSSAPVSTVTVVPA